MISFLRKSDPYQWFFPVGIALGILGVTLWAMLYLGWITFYPGLLHSQTMISGFLMTVGMGFLMTAVPRFTGTQSASLPEKSILLLLVGALILATFSNHNSLFHILAILQILFLLAFGIRRIIKSTFSPPPSFTLIAFGLLGALAGHIVLACEPSSLFLSALARLLINYGLPLGLILGVGTQLIPALLGLKRTALCNIQEGTAKKQKEKKQILGFAFYGLLLLGSFLLEATEIGWAGKILRGLLVWGLVLSQWRIYLFPKTTGVFSLSLWISAWMILVGQWPGLTGAHVFFIGSISLMIFTVATRVTLSHGGHDMALEQKSIALKIMVTFFFLALITRLAAPVTDNYFTHLAYASLLWDAAAIAWCWSFLLKLFKKNPSRG